MAATKDYYYDYFHKITRSQMLDRVPNTPLNGKTYSADNYMFNVNNRNTKTRC